MADRDVYNVARWGAGYFEVGDDGHVRVRPDGPDGPAGDLHRITSALGDHGLRLPVLLRFGGILRHRLRALREAFAQAIATHGYQGGYTPIYPIKVNQQRSVLRELTTDGALGLESGSKTELLAVLATAPAGATVVCNGYKDREYLELALHGERMGHRVLIVVEKLSELSLLLEVAGRLGMRPRIGLRLRLAAVAGGRWQQSGGAISKFGLAAPQLLEAVALLREHDLLDAFELLHVHLGSQIPDLADIRGGLEELGRTLVELQALGAAVRSVDVGGGLGIDYEGTASTHYHSIAYDLLAYAETVVGSLHRACAAAGIATPEILTESGRGLTAHHAVLVTEVLEVETVAHEDPVAPAADAAPVLHALHALAHRAEDDDPAASYAELVALRDEVLAVYTRGELPLVARAEAQRLVLAISQRIHPRLDRGDPAHADAVRDLDLRLADKLFCNLSVFQSLPDVWALDQVFPILPLSGLDQPPDRRGLVRDLTCDSDGRIDRYVDAAGVETTLPLHPPTAGPFLLGFFLVGAYQETLGDIHNLFGPTDQADVVVEADGSCRISETRAGASGEALLAEVGYRAEDLVEAFRAKLAAADMDEEEAERVMDILRDGLAGYSYLEA